MLTLIQRTATELPSDISLAISAALKKETLNSPGYQTLSIIKQNIGLAKKEQKPMCQDTGMITAIIKSRPVPGVIAIEDAIKSAAKDLTDKGILRQNSVNTLTEKNTGTNIPQIYVHTWDGPTQVYLMLKGGGSENMSTQYSLPCSNLSANRDLEGVRRCLLDAVFKAQGIGCAPGILGVSIGGDRAAGYLHAKEQLFRKLNDKNPVKKLAELEKIVLDQANDLGIGPMGLGGKTTLLGVKISVIERHPACYFVTVSYSCWATRRYAIELSDKGEIKKWL
jgi:fumarate hydratase class I